MPYEGLPADSDAEVGMVFSGEDADGNETGPVNDADGSRYGFSTRIRTDASDGTAKVKVDFSSMVIPSGSETVVATVSVPQMQPVDLAPHVFVDVNGDGRFTEDECLFNPVVKDAKGNVTSYGAFLAPGDAIDEITLSKPLKAGTYQGQVQYTAVHHGTTTQANGMSMPFTAVVSR